MKVVSLKIRKCSTWYTFTVYAILKGLIFCGYVGAAKGFRPNCITTIYSIDRNLKKCGIVMSVCDVRTVNPTVQ